MEAYNVIEREKTHCKISVIQWVINMVKYHNNKCKAVTNQIRVTEQNQV